MIFHFHTYVATRLMFDITAAIICFRHDIYAALMLLLRYACHFYPPR